jgi:glycosyltransferase involved in cell wall biosynthesis
VGKAPRVLVFTESSVRGGSEVLLRHVLNHLEANFDITVMGHTPDVVHWLAADRAAATVIVPASRRRLDIRAMVAIRRAIVACDADVFHADLAAIDGCRAALLAARTIPRLRVVTTVNSPIVRGGSRARVLAGLLNRGLAARVAVGSNLVREIESLPFSPKTPVHLIPPGIPVPAPAPSRPRPHGAVIGTIARLVSGKRVDLLVEAVAQLPRCSLIIVGEGPERTRLEALVRDRGVADRVSLVGWSEEPSSWLARFDVFALASEAEGLPLTVLEAMHAGVPVVATDVGSMRDAVEPGRTGVLVPSGSVAALVEAFRSLLDDPDRARRMGEAALDAAQRFSAEAAALSYASLYREVVGTR